MYSVAVAIKVRSYNWLCEYLECWWEKNGSLKEKRPETEEKPQKSMRKGQKKGKPTKDKRRFNGTAENHTESALWRETHDKKEKKNKKNRSSPETKINICEHYQSGFPFTSFFHSLSFHKKAG